MKKSLKILFIIIFTLIAMALVRNYYIGKLRFVIPEDISARKNLFAPTETSSLFSAGNNQEIKPTGYKHFTTPDNKLTITYSDDWIEIKDKEKIKGVVPSELAKQYDLKVLLLAQKPKIGKFLQLVVNEGNFPKEVTFSDIIEIMKNTNKKDGWEMETAKLEIKENEATFEARYTQSSLLPLFSKERLIFVPSDANRKRVYLVAVITFEKDKAEFKKEMEEIINSVRLTI